LIIVVISPTSIAPKSMVISGDRCRPFGIRRNAPASAQCLSMSFQVRSLGRSQNLRSEFFHSHFVNTQLNFADKTLPFPSFDRSVTLEFSKTPSETEGHKS
jgi:hypothetical protein